STAPVLVAATTQQIALPPPPKSDAQRAEPPVLAAAPIVKPQTVSAAHETPDAPAAALLGIWETEGGKGLDKGLGEGMVRIEPCGRALCGYRLDGVSSPKGESVLVNMRSKSAVVWTGKVFSHGSGNASFATMTLKDRGKLHVDRCALGRFFCSGNDWT